jgi:tetratricopeptide (TPR) repeat protein
METQASQPKIYVSYSWSDKDIVDIIDEDWKKIGLTLVRDIRDINYTESIRSFMRSMATGDYVLVIISKSYLQSTNCMFEAMELFKDPNFSSKILPIMVFKDSDEKIYDTIGKISYITYWEGRAKKVDEAFKTLSAYDNIAPLIEERNHLTNIRTNITEFSTLLGDMRGVSWPAIKEQNYHEIFKYIRYQPNTSEILEECNRIIKMEHVESQELALDRLIAKHGDNMYTYFTRASINTKEGKYNRAIEALEKAIKLNRNYWLAHFNLAVILSDEIKDYPKAIDEYQRVIDIFPDHTVAHINIAKILAEQYANYDEVKKYLSIALQIEPDNALAHYNMGVLERDGFSNYESAKKHFTEAIKNDPENYKAYFNLGNLYLFRFNDKRSAIEPYRKAIAINPNYDRPHANLAKILDSYGKYSEAKKYYERAIEINPADLDTRRQFIDMLIKHMSDFPEAAEQYRAILNFEPENDVAHYALAHILSNNNKDYFSAKKHYELALKINPQYISASYNLANLLMEKLGDYEGAEAQYRKTIEIDSKHFDAHHNLANLLSGPLVNYSEAEKEYKIALQLKPDFDHGYYSLAYLMSHIGRYTEAQEYYNKALAINPNNAQAHHNLATLLQKDSKNYDARKHYILSIKSNPKTAFSSHYNLAFLLKDEFDDEAEAKKHYLAACQLEPSFRSFELDKVFGV